MSTDNTQPSFDVVNNVAALQENFTPEQAVDAAWGMEFVESARKLDHMLECFDPFFITPRMVKIVILRPDSIIRLLKQQHKMEMDASDGEKTAFEEDKFYFDHERWCQPEKTHLHLNVFKAGKEHFDKGLTPMQALQNIYADSKDGDENQEIFIGSPNMLGLAIGVGLVAMIIGWHAQLLSIDKRSGGKTTRAGKGHADDQQPIPDFCNQWNRL
jgi:hypothetical protein